MRRCGVVFVPFFCGLALCIGGCDLLGLGKSESDREKKVDRRAQEAPPPQLTYVGRETCGKCHEDEVQSYAWSAHDRSTELPEGEALEAPFEGETLKEGKSTATFIRKKGAPIISSGQDHPVRWTIGFFPLQQYVVPGEAGRFFAFTGAFDTRNKGDGGKRWYFPDEANANAPHDFRGPEFVWNSQCAHCHSTSVEKNYDWEKDVYDTKFQEIDVSCEACHGPASRHVTLAEQNKNSEKWPTTVPNAGFDLALATYTLRRWVRAPDEKVARLAGDGESPPEKTDELLACAPCHSTSTDLGPSGREGSPNAFEDRYALRLLEEELFYADGQARGSVYAYNSFAQTKMHHAGVICSDCHNPHAGTLRTPAAQLCISCHDPETYGVKAHSLHEEQHDVACVDCHMPEKDFLGADKRRDHRFPIPRPDLALTMDVPNACGTCHAHRPKWAATVIATKLGEGRPKTFATILHSAEKGDDDAPQKLNTLFKDSGVPDLVRASALQRWATLGRSTPELHKAVQAGCLDESSLVRRAAAEAVPLLPEKDRLKALTPLFEDKARTVRIAAALAALQAPAPKKPSEAMNRAMAEAKVAESFRADGPEGLVSLAALEERRGSSASMEHLFQLAEQRYPQDPRVFSAWAAAMQRWKTEESAQEVVLRGLKLHALDPTLLFARGRYLVRREEPREALPFLQVAFDKAPRTHRKEYGYVYAVTVHKLGDWAEALAILRLLKREYPEAQEVQEALNIYSEKRDAR